MSSTRHTFVVTVHEDGRVAVVEDVRTGAHARVSDLGAVGAQIAVWLAGDDLPPRVDLPPALGGDSRPGH